MATVCDVYATAETYSRYVGLMRNRCRVINDTLGHDRDWCEVRRLGRGRWCVVIGSRRLAEWETYEIEGVRTAFERVDAAADAVWQVRIIGFLYDHA